MGKKIKIVIMLIISSNLLLASSNWTWWYNRPAAPAPLQTGVSSTTFYPRLWGTTGRTNPNALVIKPSDARRKSIAQWTCSTINENNGNIILGGTYNNRFAIAWITPGQTLEGSMFIFPAIAGGTKEKCKAIMVDSVGNIIVAGTSSVPGGNSYFAAGRITPDNVIDTSFGRQGMTRIPFSLAGGGNDQCNAIALDNQSNIILAGTSTDRSGRTFFSAVRLQPNGVVDTTFENRGVKVLPSLAGGINNQCTTVSIDQYNNIILSGTSSDTTGNTYFAATKIPALTN
jgi:uncharacterized delta-60 repeat protein